MLMRRIVVGQMRDLCERFHGYGSVGASATYAFGVFEDTTLVAAYAWQPPPPGVARAVAPEAPEAVLALSRMIALPKEQRALKHISKPLRRQMKHEIDRTRWPVLITFSDEGLGHTGYTYQCSGWKKTTLSKRPFYTDGNGHRISSYSNGRHRSKDLLLGGITTLQRWEHWVCAKGQAKIYMVDNGWMQIPVPGKMWRSGNQAYTYINQRMNAR